MTFFQFIYRNMIRNLRIYVAYFLSSMISVMIFFIYTLFVFHPQMDRGVVIENTIQGMIAANLIHYLFAFFYVAYSIGALLQARRKEISILFMHGMTSKQFRQMVLVENTLIGSSAIVVGISCGLVTGKLFLMAGAAIMHIPPLSFYFPWQAIGITIILFILLFLLLSWTTPFFAHRGQMALLEQRKRDETSRISIFLSLFSVTLLCSSYYLTLTTTKFTVFIRFFPVVIMMILGSYFFFTQGIIWLMKFIKKAKGIFWRKINVIVISSLVIRLRENARHLFLATMVFTVGFCTLGIFASTNVLNKQFQLDYPIAVGYVAKNKQANHQKNLGLIKNELSMKGIHYTTASTVIKYIEVASKEIPIIAFSEYKTLSSKSGFRFREEPLGIYEAMGLLTSQLDQYPKQETYKIKKSNVELNQSKTGQHVVIPWRLLQSQGLIVSDELFKQLPATHTEVFTGFYSEKYIKTIGIGNSLAKEGRVMPSDHKNYAMVVSGTLLQNQIRLYRMIFFITLLTTIVFFIAAGSILYFRLYADLVAESKRFTIVSTIGYTERDRNQAITWQLGVLFLLPIGVATLHSLVAFVALQNYFALSIAVEMAIVIISFWIAHIVFFLLIRYRYLWNLKKQNKQSRREIHGELDY
ncbi:putative ABC transport system permease protein [Seinonella peptonophila]|uniref:Putative ABC transport system permease protein n=1 Tax=Seinonella peptonophila TaxID=112248 RepID=A0A1M4X304_9BACL|nr:FtsX-like permease family protein [Seinonella peptonophila]SHE87851.1 putative ABC transport system permease protein [Seinonella peptonophila]